jgi:hypothetical protein
MAAIKHRIPWITPEIEYGEIDIPDSRDMGTGSFTTVLKPNTLAFLNKPVISVMAKKPVFQISVELNPQTGLITVLLGKADGTEPVSNETFRFPFDMDSQPGHCVIARFKDWKIANVTLNDSSLEEKR